MHRATERFVRPVVERSIDGSIGSIHPPLTANVDTANKQKNEIVEEEEEEKEEEDTVK